MAFGLAFGYLTIVTGRWLFGLRIAGLTLFRTRSSLP